MPRTLRCISTKRKKTGKGTVPKSKASSNTLHGEDFTVIAIDILALDSIVDGELIPADEIEYTHQSWNGRAVLDRIVPENQINHPRALESHGFGQLFRVRIEDGFLRADAWLSPKRAEGIGKPDLIAACQDGAVRISPVVSCTLVDRSGTKDGASYNKSWESVSPFYVAVLSNETTSAALTSQSSPTAHVQAHVAERAFIAEHRSRPRTTTGTQTISANASQSRNVSHPIINQPSAPIGATTMPSAVSQHLSQHIDLLSLPPMAFEILSAKSRYADVYARMGHGREETIDHLFVKHLAQLRCMAGLTQKDLAEEMNVTPQTVSNWETKTSRPNFETKAAAVEACLSIALDSASTDLDRAFRANAESAETSDAADVADFLDRMTKYLFPRRGVALARFLATQARENDHSRPDPHGVEVPNVWEQARQLRREREQAEERKRK